MSTEGDPLAVAGIRVLPLGPIPRSLAGTVTAQLSRRVTVPCRLESPPRDLDLPRLPGRNQLDADRLLAALEERVPDDGEILLGLTALDLGNPIFTFFFGRARSAGRAALVSLARLSPAFYGLADATETTVRRARLEILHELGHVAGLPHCSDAACLMRFCTSVEAIDNRGTTFCPTCSRMLPEAFTPVTTRSEVDP